VKADCTIDFHRTKKGSPDIGEKDNRHPVTYRSANELILVCRRSKGLGVANDAVEFVSDAQKFGF